MKHNVPNIVKVALVVLMLLCLFDMPYGYFEFTRFAAFVGFGYLAYDVQRHGAKSDLCILYVVLAILFQPFYKLAFGREFWNILEF